MNTASTAPAAVRVWPIIDLFDEIGMLRMRSPNTVGDAEMLPSCRSPASRCRGR